MKFPLKNQSGRKLSLIIQSKSKLRRPDFGSCDKERDTWIVNQTNHYRWDWREKSRKTEKLVNLISNCLIFFVILTNISLIPFCDHSIFQSMYSSFLVHIRRVEGSVQCVFHKYAGKIASFYSLCICIFIYRFI